MKIRSEEFLSRLEQIRDQLKGLSEDTDDCDGEPDGASDFNARYWASALIGDALDLLNEAASELNGTANDHYCRQELKKATDSEAAK